ncbi:tetratricopeptide repeat protein [Aliiglaciecola sp. LCG003]|uniref:tetratricopeptide repeat protein n=1 Tax=Aliiglaciecola sp. LCG003 TaxID=3053655 RepID=UPI002572445F|nr:tetratricopeptide repeat protein [Aliiglaciecola sp. LCG003]WJG08814.1 tetratricopeptide repeat protein [Aliiglaciecola sp. LCG003]
MKSIPLFFIILSALLGCQTASNPITQQSDSLLNDQAYPQYKEINIETEQQIFGLDQEAIDFVRHSVGKIQDPVDRMETLISKIFDRSEFNLLYMGSANTTATQTFKNRAANCLSMSIMTYALAKEAGFSVRFQDIQIPEYWTRREGYSLLNGHINLQISPRDRNGIIHLLADGYEVDFDPQSNRKKFPKQFVGKEMVIAMFYNNKGADALLSGNHTKAYAYFKHAAEIAPKFESTWVNLGILYRLSGYYDDAQNSYNHAIELQPGNLTAWENLAFLYDYTGRTQEAQAINARLERLRGANPFYHYILGEQELDNGNLDLALKHYRDALRLDKSKHEIYFGLAKTYYQLGDINRSQMYFKRARDRSRNDQDQMRYQGKLDLLSSHNDKNI